MTTTSPDWEATMRDILRKQLERSIHYKRPYKFLFGRWWPSDPRALPANAEEPER